MKIGILVMFAGRGAGGPEVYEVELLRALAQIDGENEYHVFCLNGRARDVIGVSAENFIFHEVRPEIRVISMLTTLPIQLSAAGTQVLHAPIIPPPVSPQDYVMTLVCSTTFKHPEFYPPAIRLRLRTLLHRGIRKSKMILCVSNSVRELCAEEFRLPLEKLKTVYLGASRNFRPLGPEKDSSVLKERFGITDPYFLFSGRWEKRKNVVRILEAFSLFKRKSHLPHKLVLTGSRTWASREAEATIADNRLEQHIVDLGKSPVQDLPLLYAGADALVFASLWEGFGMPIVEAMACGTPVITSNCSSMPEIAGEAGLLVDPYSAENIAFAMQQLGGDADLRARLSAAGLKRSQHFTWERCARETLVAYEQFVSMS